MPLHNWKGSTNSHLNKECIYKKLQANFLKTCTKIATRKEILNQKMLLWINGAKASRMIQNKNEPERIDCFCPLQQVWATEYKTKMKHAL